MEEHCIEFKVFDKITKLDIKSYYIFNNKNYMFFIEWFNTNLNESYSFKEIINNKEKECIKSFIEFFGNTYEILETEEELTQIFDVENTKTYFKDSDSDSSDLMSRTETINSFINTYNKQKCFKENNIEIKDKHFLDSDSIVNSIKNFHY